MNYNLIKTDRFLKYSGIRYELNPVHTDTASIVLRLIIEERRNGIIDGYKKYVAKNLETVAYNPPAFESGHYSSYPILCAAIALAKRTPAIWDILSDEVKERLYLIMKMFAYVGNFATRRQNDYKTGLLLKGDVSKHWSPNFRLAMYPQVIYCADFFGIDEMNKLFLNFSYDNTMSELENYGFSSATYVWKTDGVKDLLENGGTAYVKDRFGNVFEAGSGIGIKHEYMVNPTVVLPSPRSLLRHCYSGGAVASKVDVDGDGTFDAYIADGTTSPVEYQEGMMLEFNSGGAVGALRSSLKYCMMDFVLSTAMISSCEELGVYNIFDDYAMLQKVRVGNTDLLYKAEHGYHGIGLLHRDTYTEESIIHDFGFNVWKDYWNEHYA